MSTTDLSRPEWEQLETELSVHHALTALLPPRPISVRPIALPWLRPNPFQVRQRFHEVEVLGNAILSHGVRFHLRVRPDTNLPGSFQVAFGERWVRAANRAGLPELLCEIAEYSDEEMFEIGLAEHIRRNELDPLEEAFAFRTLIETKDRTIEQLEARIGKPQSYIVQRLSLLSKPPRTTTTPTLAASITDRLEPVIRVAAYADTAPPPAPPTTPAMAPAAPAVAALPASRSNRTGVTPMRRIAERDLRTMQTIVARWQMILQTNTPEQLPDQEYLQRILHEVRQACDRMQEYLAHHHHEQP